MTTSKSQWSKKEFLAYVLIYAAHADIHFKEEEKKHILSIIEPDVYEKIYKEFSKDNGYVQVQKIIIHQKLNDHFSTESIVEEMENLFLSDNHFHRLEQYTLSNVKRLLV